ncbi:Protein tweety -like protein 3 [Takifugu flavidus]|uniref:Protein tweety homolog n=1 Tax=Takifugu flavidus TaxID=433684 RepID=A0A5C6NT83_9TELE|nr:Protein tweety -like protein 3 [Takifugu flavidus]
MASVVSYSPPWWVNLLHRLPHFNLRFEQTSSDFQPEDWTYQQSIFLLGGVALACLALDLLFLFFYSIFLCCRRSKNEEQPNADCCCTAWCVIIATLVCSAGIAVGFYGNGETCDGVNRLTYALRHANHTITGVQKLVYDSTSSLNQTVDDSLQQLEEQYAERVDYLSIVQKLQGQLEELVHQMVEIPFWDNTYVSLEELAVKIELYDWYRWSGYLGLLLFDVIICLLALFGLIRNSKGTLIGVCLFGVVALIISWVSLGVELAVSATSSDFCVSPDTYVVKVANQYGVINQALWFLKTQTNTLDGHKEHQMSARAAQKGKLYCGSASLPAVGPASDSSGAGSPRSSEYELLFSTTRWRCEVPQLLQPLLGYRSPSNASEAAEHGSELQPPRSASGLPGILRKHILQYYLSCSQEQTNPFQQKLSGSHKALVEMQDDVSELLRSAIREYRQTKGSLEEIQGILNTTEISLHQLTALVDCRSLHMFGLAEQIPFFRGRLPLSVGDYVQAVTGLCYDGLEGFIYLLLFSFITALMFSSIVCSVPHTWQARRSDEDSEDESLSHGGRQNHDNLYRVHMPSLYSCGSSYGSETSIPAAAHTVSNAPVTEYMAQNANFQNSRCENTPLIGRESPPPSSLNQPSSSTEAGRGLLDSGLPPVQLLFFSVLAANCSLVYPGTSTLTVMNTDSAGLGTNHARFPHLLACFSFVPPPRSTLTAGLLDPLPPSSPPCPGSKRYLGPTLSVL